MNGRIKKKSQMKWTWIWDDFKNFEAKKVETCNIMMTEFELIYKVYSILNCELNTKVSHFDEDDVKFEIKHTKV